MDCQGAGRCGNCLRELRARKHPNYDSACFHAQQCVEKHMEAFLLEKRIAFKHVHDLETLLDSCLQAGAILESLRLDAQLLTQYAVQFRYPGENADKQEAKQAVQAMRRCMDSINELLQS